ncbi:MULTISPECIES: trimeric intracellular cation channel family protein [Cupriavidus]|uniref:Trimeric intracellular cation channel family protein n=1 Tax=Cupriavidus oxalaticus TaxID=96344 RepID=A0A4P7LAA0_9BURK|nr:MULTISPECIES: trimeric intracellular cation channel family protein [Cupriavidus]MBF6988896.1 trimeric intracellular cation channel family protein [Cupriavidus sp. IK-TO18]QBY52375.1 trimeric intracellular cation channel family protein [Cupriavidus oxalaticus]TDF66234.1 trimeric intracellular cation channel family protein [Cupriavidus sp. L7L]
MHLPLELLMGRLPLILHIMEVIGVLAFAVSGVVDARKQRLDVVGTFVVAFATAFGGGTLRDVLLDRRPFYWVEHEGYVLLIFAMSFGASFVLRVVSRVASDRALIVADAIGLGLFSVTGTSLALVGQMTPTVAVMMGIISSVFGGVVRDVLCNEVPMILRDRSPYATCSFVGCWIYIGLTWMEVQQEAALMTGALAIIAMRLVSVRYGWKLPS